MTPAVLTECSIHSFNGYIKSLPDRWRGQGVEVLNRNSSYSLYLVAQCLTYNERSYESLQQSQTSQSVITS